MGEDIIETLVTELAPPTVTSGFNTPFTVERLCKAFGENLGGNAPEPSWFEGYDVVVAVRRGSRGTPYMPTAALLRRRADGALRFIASDHLLVRGEVGADFMLGTQHREIVMDAILEACEEGSLPAAVRHARETVDAAHNSLGAGPVDILAIRRGRDDLADIRAAREIAPVIARLEELLNGLSSSTRRAETLSTLSALRADLGLDPKTGD